MDYQPLDCSLYDLIEVFCLRGYSLLIETHAGELIAAKALTTRTVSTEGEFLQIESCGDRREIRLDMIAAVTVTTENTQYGRIEFGALACVPPEA